MAETYHFLKIAQDGPITIITINRPKSLNALNTATIEELDEAIDDIVDSDSTRAVIITGAGDKAFVAGADISKMPDMNEDEASTFSRRGSEVFRRLERLPLPVVAAVNGFALGGGCELMLACDFAYASTNARMGQPEVTLGIIAGFGGTQRLPRKIGYGPAMELLMNGGNIDAERAYQLGLVNKVCDPEALLDTVKEAVNTILSRAPIAVAMTKQAVQDGLDTDIETGLEIESTKFASAFGTSDAKEGIAAFLEKRPPEFKGE